MTFKIWRKIKSMGDYTSVRFAIHELIPELAASGACDPMSGAQKASLSEFHYLPSGFISPTLRFRTTIWYLVCKLRCMCFNRLILVLNLRTCTAVIKIGATAADISSDIEMGGVLPICEAS
jgi:hypothetical protein